MHVKRRPEPDSWQDEGLEEARVEEERFEEPRQWSLGGRPMSSF